MLTGKSIVLGVTGGIAAYKAADVVSRLKKLNASVDVIMTENATQFIAPLTFETLSAKPVTVNTFTRPNRWEVEHVALAKKADLMLVAPATANIMAKLRCGIADDMLTTTLLAAKSPILLAPAMNTGMWEAAAMQENLSALILRGIHMVGPSSGLLACGDIGVGRMSDPEDIVQAAIRLLYPLRDMEGLRVLITAGPTIERIDPVRFLSNHSSGKMGYALAEAARDRGAQVTLVSGPVQLPPPQGMEVVNVYSTEDLAKAVWERCSQQDLLLQAAAPADYRPKDVSEHKLKKQNGTPMILELHENPDIAQTVGKQKRLGQILVGFAAETNDLLANAKAKLVSKNLDMIVANDVTLENAGFGVDTNIVTLITANGEESLPLMSKRQVAETILSRALGLRINTP